MPHRPHASRFAAAVLAVVALVSSAPGASVLAEPTGTRPASLAGVSTTPPGLRAEVVAGAFAPVARHALASDEGAVDIGPRHAPATVALAAASPKSAVKAPVRTTVKAPVKAPVKRTVAPRTVAVPKPRPAAQTTTTVYRGTNHMWMPALGINRSVSWFPCSRSTPPGLAVYRWGCAGANNVYLFAHAYAAFKPLHDAYVGGRLRKGMKVMYADGSGRVRTYAIAWWRLTTPDNGAFAYAAQSRPSLTLQTCVGSRSQYRLIVRLVQVG
jgi:Sortase domain